MDAFFPPGPHKSLLLGNAAEFQRNPFATLIDSAQNYGDLVHFRFGPSHAYLVTNPDDAQYVLRGAAHLFHRDVTLGRALNSAFGHELFPPKETHSRASQPLSRFRIGWLADFGDMPARYAAEAVDEMHAHPLLDLPAAMKRLALSVAARALFDVAAGELPANLDDALYYSPLMAEHRYRSPLSLPAWVPTPGKRREAEAMHNLGALLTERIGAGRDYTASHSIVARLLNGGEATTETRDELAMLLEAGYESVASTLTWALILLAQHPDAAQRLRDEVDTTLEGRLPTFEDLENLPYARMVIQETMRLYPPTWIISRQAKTEARLGEYYVPSGSTVFVSPYTLHHSRRYWVNAERFLPERFVTGYEKRIRRSAYIPFGVGERAAVAMPFALALSTLLLATLAGRADWTLLPGQMLTPEARLALWPMGGAQMHVRAREAQTA